MPPAGLEPATLWLEATRAIRLRHGGKLPDKGLEPLTTRLKV